MSRKGNEVYCASIKTLRDFVDFAVYIKFVFWLKLIMEINMEDFSEEKWDALLAKMLREELEYLYDETAFGDL